MDMNTITSVVDGRYTDFADDVSDYLKYKLEKSDEMSDYIGKIQDMNYLKSSFRKIASEVRGEVFNLDGLNGSNGSNSPDVSNEPKADAGDMGNGDQS